MFLSSISVLHMSQNLFSLYVIGLMCLPFSIQSEWFDNLKRDKAILCFGMISMDRYGSRLMFDLYLLKDIAFELDAMLTPQNLSYVPWQIFEIFVWEVSNMSIFRLNFSKKCIGSFRVSEFPFHTWMRHSLV